MINELILKNHSSYKEHSLTGRYVNYQQIELLIKKWNTVFKVEELGFSENKLPIHLITLGKGSKKLLFWSQMHGNESTTTKAVFDLLHFLNDKSNELSQKILKECTLYIVPMLNPDGAGLYTRANFNKIDLNRDAQDLTQVESQLFNTLVNKVDPLVAFNLHGQRTIFSAGKTNNSAIVSFLSPASNVDRTITESRQKGMRIIAEMNKELQNIIPNCVGRYDDGFNLNCTGDTLENKGITTILFEAGHYPKDYDREITRKMIYLSLVTALNFISDNGTPKDEFDAYFEIPENDKCFNDIIIRNYDLEGSTADISIQYKEQLIGGELIFSPYVFDIQEVISNFGHVEFDCKIHSIQILSGDKKLKINSKIDVFKINDKEFSVFPIK